MECTQLHKILRETKTCIKYITISNKSQNIRYTLRECTHASDIPTDPSEPFQILFMRYCLKIIEN